MLEHLEKLSLSYESRNLELMNEIFHKYVCESREERDNFIKFLKRKQEKYGKRNSLEKWMNGVSNRPETEREMAKLSLQAAIEVRNVCRQM